MAKSRYEKLIVRRPDMPAHAGPEEGIRGENWVNTGALVLCDKKLFPQAGSIVEYGMAIGDNTLGLVPGGPQPHKHDYDELFIFLGTDPKNVNDLGAEVELWLGEGKELEKVVLNTSCSMYIPAGLAHLPQIWKNVRRPVIYLLIMFGSTEYVFENISGEGRPIQK